MNILQINTVFNSGSTGRIVSEIGQEIVKLGGKSYVGYGRGEFKSSYSELIKIGDKIDFYLHAIKTRLFDLHGFGSVKSTNDFIKLIDNFQIDIVHLHNIHGYYININLLFEYLKNRKIPVVWTLHDCWSFTGHCSHYSLVNCQKWATLCYNCPQIDSYPASVFIDNSKSNFLRKKTIFNSIDNLTLVPVSKWLEKEVKKSFLRNHKIKQIYNGINLEQFDSKRNIPSHWDLSRFKEKKIILGVANVWSDKKGLSDFIKLREMLSNTYEIVLIGVSKSQLKALPLGITGISRTKNLDELVWWYSNSLVFFNPTFEDTYPTVNLESISCGTPVITYNTGGSAESISTSTGYVINQGDLAKAVELIDMISSFNREVLRRECREYASKNFCNSTSYKNYIKLYKEILNK